MESSERKLELGPQQWSMYLGEPTPCAECRGRGKIALFTSDRECPVCKGEGQIWPEPVVEHTPPKLGYWHTDRRYDELGRLIQETTWFEPVKDAEPANSKSDVRNRRL